MTTRKVQSGLALFALALFFMMATNVSAFVPCNMCLYTSDTKAEFDPSQGACFSFFQDDGVDESKTTPFEADYIRFDDDAPLLTVNSFRYVGFESCTACTLTAYSSADYTGKSEVLKGNAYYGGLSFCAKSFKMFCDVNILLPGEEEEEEEVEAEEEEE